jgi:hypothetical protein
MSRSFEVNAKLETTWSRTSACQCSSGIDASGKKQIAGNPGSNPGRRTQILKYVYFDSLNSVESKYGLEVLTEFFSEPKTRTESTFRTPKVFLFLSHNNGFGPYTQGSNGYLLGRSTPSYRAFRASVTAEKRTTISRPTITWSSSNSIQVSVRVRRLSTLL